MQVYERERQSCDLGLFTHAFSLFMITLPHVLVSAVLTAVIFVPWSDLNQSGALLCLRPHLQSLRCF